VTHELWMDRQVSGYGYGSNGQGGGWKGLKQVVLIRTTHELISGKEPKTVEDHYYLTSLGAYRRQGKPDALISIGRCHWEIENVLHHKKDRSMGEDAQRCKRGASIWARIRSMGVGLLSFIKGATTPLKQITVAANPNIACKLLIQKKFIKLENM